MAINGTRIPLGVDNVMPTVLVEEPGVETRCIDKDRLRPRAVWIARSYHIVAYVLEYAINLIGNGICEPKRLFVSS